MLGPTWFYFQHPAVHHGSWNGRRKFYKARWAFQFAFYFGKLVSLIPSVEIHKFSVLSLINTWEQASLVRKRSIHAPGLPRGESHYSLSEVWSSCRSRRVAFKTLPSIAVIHISRFLTGERPSQGAPGNNQSSAISKLGFFLGQSRPHSLEKGALFHRTCAKWHHRFYWLNK